MFHKSINSLDDYDIDVSDEDNDSYISKMATMIIF